MGDQETTERTEVRIAMKADLMRSDLQRGLVWFVNYAAIDPTAVTVKDLDLHGTAMLPEDVEKFAHRWLSFSRSVDIEHDGIGRPVYTAESFYNSEDIASPVFPINSHAARLDVSRSKEALEGLRSGKLNSVSLDALTFNRVVRLPVAASAMSAPDDGAWARPTDLSAWAYELAQEGWPGVTGIREVGSGLFVAMRSAGMPVAVQVHEDGIEASGVSSGPWARLALAAYESPSLTRMDLAATNKPAYRAIDHTPWDPQLVANLLGPVGIDLAGTIVRDGPIEQEVFAAIDAPALKGFLPHHTHRGGHLMLSRDGVQKAMRQLDTVPEALRPAALEHLRGHMAELGGA